MCLFTRIYSYLPPTQATKLALVAGGLEEYVIEPQQNTLALNEKK